MNHRSIQMELVSRRQDEIAARASAAYLNGEPEFREVLRRKRMKKAKKLISGRIW